jgi:hypothetical protein
MPTDEPWSRHDGPDEFVDEEYLAERERVGWQSVTLIAAVCVAVVVLLAILGALLASRR